MYKYTVVFLYILYMSDGLLKKFLKKNNSVNIDSCSEMVFTEETEFFSRKVVSI